MASDDVIAAQRAALAAATDGKGYGPQSPRDISTAAGNNTRVFSEAPAATAMSLCDIHFHENAEHKGGEFTTYAGNGDGHGYGTGFKYDGTLSAAELAPIDRVIGASEHGDLVPGDTIEVHFVHSTAQASLGNSLGTCLSEAIGNPQLRVETVVAVLVSEGGADFNQMAKIEQINGLNQVPNLPDTLGTPVVYEGSTTGPGYNEKGSPFQVTWSVRPQVAKVNIGSLGDWLEDNPFDEDHAHGVRNLVLNPDLLSAID
ncbi:hypothetical protein NBRC116596_20960 [Litorivita sp. NS0012-18]